MSKARLLADLMSDSQITASEITGLELNAIQEGDTVVEVVDDGAGGKVVVRVDGSNNAEFNAGGMVVPSGTTAERDPSAALGSLRYNTTIGFFETFTGSGWGTIATPPSVTGISPTSFSGEANASFTVTGAFFDSASTVKFVGSDGTLYSTGTITFVDSTELQVTNSVNLPVANEPYVIRVTNGAGLSADSSVTLDAGSVPSFTTASGNIATTTNYNDPISVTVQASDAETSITGYTITQGTLPTGVTLNSTTGLISGTASNQATTTYTFTIEATDTAGNTNTREFNIQIVNAAPVWDASPADGDTITFFQNASNSLTLNATDPEGETVSYSITSGTLPSGTTLSGSTISGTPSSLISNNSVTFAASDGFNSIPRSFYINVVTPWAEGSGGAAGLYSAGAWDSGGGDYVGQRFGLPVVNYAGNTWLVWATGGTNPFGIPNFNRHYAPTAQNSQIPTTTNIVTTDWSSQREQTQFSFAGYKDYGSSGWNNINGSLGANYVNNYDSSSNYATILPPETLQHIIVFADFYRSNNGTNTNAAAVGTYEFNGSGTGFTGDALASWRGSAASGTSYGLDNLGSNADLYRSAQHTANSSYYVFVLESGYTISTFGFVLIRVKTGTTSLSFT